MLSRHVGSRKALAADVVTKALGYFAKKQLADGCITDTSENLILGIWDSVHSLRALALWRDALVSAGDASRSAGIPILSNLLGFLRSKETAEGLMSWGDREPQQYSCETSSEYITALAQLGEAGQARTKAEALRNAQLPSGAWREHHSHIPEVFQTMPSVTAFALRALWLVDLEPHHLDEALAFLRNGQNDEGHWGYNWYYNAVPYYVTMPVTEVLARYSCYASLGKTLEYVLSGQRPDGSWCFDLDGYGNQLSPCVHTVYAMETLMHCGLGHADEPVARGLAWLLTAQRHDGSWHGGNFPYPPADQYRNFHTTQDVYSTAAVLVMLDKYVKLAS